MASFHMRQMGFWLSLSVAMPLSAQQTTWSVGTSLGYALPHRNEMLALVTGHSREMTCRIGNWNTTGWRQNWQQHGRFGKAFSWMAQRRK